MVKGRNGRLELDKEKAMIQNFNIDKVTNINVSGIDMSDYPDFCDAYIMSADYETREMTDEELEWIENEYPDHIHEWISEQALS